MSGLIPLYRFPNLSCGADANINKKYIQAQLTAAAEGSIVAEECFGSIRTVCLPALHPGLQIAINSVRGCIACRPAPRCLVCKQCHLSPGALVSRLATPTCVWRDAGC